MDRDLKNKYLDMLIDEYGKYLAVDDFKSVLAALENIAYSINWEDCSGMFTALYETIPECIDDIDPAMLWKFTSENKYLEEFKIPERITSIGNSAFRNCSSLTNIRIPDSVTSIGDSTFFDCNNLTSVTIPNGVKKIEGDTFAWCNSLKNITIPNSVTSIGSYTFWNCNNLTSIKIPPRVTSIGSYAFLNCSGLTNITIPDSVTSIDNSTFTNCPNLIIYTKNQYVIDYCKENDIEYEKI